MLRYVPVVEIGDPQIKEYIEDHREVEEGEIKPVTLGANHILYRPVNAQHPKQLNQQVHEYQQDQVGDKLVPQNMVLLIRWLKIAILPILCTFTRN